MFYLAGIVITFFLLLLLSTKKNKTGADKILATWLFFIGVHLIFYYLFINDKITQWPYLLGLEIPLPLVHGPFLLLYTAAITQQLPKRNKGWLYFLPVILAYALMAPFFLLSNAEKVKVYQNQGAGYENTTRIIFVAVLISGIAYTLLSYKKLLQHRRNINNQFSNTEKITLHWLQYLIAGISMIWLLVWIGDDRLIYAAVVLYVIFIGYFGIKQVGIFTYQHKIAVTDKINSGFTEQPPIVPVVQGEPDEPGENGTDKIKYQKSALPQEQMEAIQQRLAYLMRQEKLFKNPELTLAEVSQKINIHPNVLSQVINAGEQKTFFDYINHHRVEEFKRIVQLPESQQYTLLSMAFECGFNSKTSFNRNFKKATGISPSDFVKQASTSQTS